MTTTLISGPKTLFPNDIVKQYLRIDDDHSDQILSLFLRMAEDYAEKITGLRTMQRKYQFNQNNIRGKSIAIPLTSVYNIESLKLDDKSVDSSNYKLENNKIILSITANKLECILDDGPKSFEDMNSVLKIGVLNHIAYLYENRGSDNMSSMPSAISKSYDNLITAKI